MSRDTGKSTTARLIGVLEEAGDKDMPPVRALAAAAAALVAATRTDRKQSEGTEK